MPSGSIIITAPNGLEQQIGLGSGSIRVGSAPDNTLIVDGAEMEPHHATITCDERGRLVIEIGAENLAGQGGMRLTFNLANITRRRDLAWIGDYVVSYQPISWNTRTQPLSLADLPTDAEVPQAAPAAHPSADETMLLHALLSQSVGGHDAAQHEATTLAMPLLALSVCKA